MAMPQGPRGAVYAYAGSTYRVIVETRRSIFKDNTATSNGGAIYSADNYEVSLHDSTFERNEGSWGGAFFGTRGAAFTATDSRFEGQHRAQRNGRRPADPRHRGLHPARQHLLRTTQSSTRGGALALAAAGADPAVVDANLFVENQAGTTGGAIYVETIPMAATNNHFVGKRVRGLGPQRRRDPRQQRRRRQPGEQPLRLEPQRQAPARSTTSRVGSRPVSYNLFFGNDSGQSNRSLDATNLTGIDPLLQGLQRGRRLLQRRPRARRRKPADRRRCPLDP